MRSATHYCGARRSEVGGDFPGGGIQRLASLRMRQKPAKHFSPGSHPRHSDKAIIVKIVDLSRELYHRTPSYPGQPPVMHGIWKTHEDSFVESGNVHGLASMFISMPDHAGTHIDAPRHFGKSGIPINEYPLEKCIVPGICIDLRHIAPRAEIAPSDLEAAVAKAGVAVPEGGTVLLCTGHHERTFPRKEYASDNSGVNVAATEWLAGQGVVHFGIDSMRPGPAGDVNALVHKACLDLDITHIESLCNLEALLGQGQFTFIGLPMKWRYGTASPIRAVAVFGM
jgi:kynurenine formamidase